MEPAFAFASKVKLKYCGETQEGVRRGPVASYGLPILKY